jgi:uncharacterized protein with HEPN domain
MRSNKERLLDILEAIEQIEKYTASGRESLQNELVQVWVIHHLQVIGEAVRALADEMRESHPDIPWTQIIGMRNILVHRYFGIDEDIVWTAIDKDLPTLKQKVKVLLDG